MKSISNILVLLALTAMTACSSDDIVPGSTSRPEDAVQVTANIESLQTRINWFDDGSGYFETGDQWGMYAYTDAANPGERIEYYYRETNLYWSDLSETDPVTFSAHTPMCWTENPTSFMYGSTLHYGLDDLLFASTTKSKGETIDLTFRHLMHRLEINLIRGEGMEGANLDAARISSTGRDGRPTMAAKVEVNLLTGDVNTNHVEDFVRLTGSGYRASWNVAPQYLTPGADWFTIGLDGTAWYYRVPEDLDLNKDGKQTCLESGKKLTLDLVLNKAVTPGGDIQTTVVLRSAQISGWADGSSIDDEIVIGD